MKKKAINFSAGFILFTLILFYSSLWGQIKDLPELVQITTHPASDFQPAVSPDGKWLAFVSDRSGNIDIWVKKLPHGTPRQITGHRAEDFLPSWSPDSRQIVFVSKRSDALGDIWLASISFKGDRAKVTKMRQITHFKGKDFSPCFSSDKKYIAFTSERSGKENIFVYDVSKDTSLQLTTKGGFEPAWSPAPYNLILFTSTRKNASGNLYIIRADFGELKSGKVKQITSGTDMISSGSWAPDSRSIVFVRKNGEFESALFTKHINADSVFFYSYDPAYEKELQITPALNINTHPSWSINNKIFFCSGKNKKLDVWSIPKYGTVSPGKNPRQEYEKILLKLSSCVSKDAQSYIILAFESLIKRFPENKLIVSKSLIQQGNIYLSLNDTADALIKFKKGAETAKQGSDERGRALLKFIIFSKIPVQQKIKSCFDIADNTDYSSRIRAEAFMQLGDLYSIAEQYSKALEAYSQVLNFYPRYGNIRAQTFLKIGDLFSFQGQQETADKQYLTVLSEYSNVPLWRKRAGDRLLRTVHGTVKDRIIRLREIIKNTEETPSLQAQAHLMICETLFDSLKFNEARQELTETKNLYPLLSWVQAKADLMLSEVYIAREDELKALFLLKDIESDYAMVEGGRFSMQAREKRFNLLLKTGIRLINSGDFALAESRLRQALEIHPEDYRVHRGLTRASFFNGTLDALISEYKQKLKISKNASLYYGYGLALSYKGENNTKSLFMSNRMLQKSLKLNYTEPYPYLTLSYNYELAENITSREKQKNPGFLKKTAQIVFSPILMLKNVFVPSSDLKTDFYEKAIQSLLTGIEVNDQKKNPDLERMLVQNLANNFYKLGQYGYSKALYYYKQRLDLDTSFSSVTEKAVFFQRAGHCGVFLQDSAAIPFLKTALNEFEKLGDTDQELATLNLMAFYFYLAGKYEEGLPYYLRIGNRFEVMGRYKDAEIAYRNLAYNYYLLGDPAEVVAQCKKAEKMLARVKRKNNKEANNYIKLEIFGLSIPVWKVQGIGSGFSEGFSYDHEAALLYGLLSRSSEELGILHESINYELKRLEIFKHNKDKLAVRVCLNRIGVLYLKQGRESKAWDYLLDAYKNCRKAKDLKGSILTSLNIGYTSLKKLSSEWNQDQADFIRNILNYNIRESKFASMIHKVEILNILGGMEAVEASHIKSDSRSSSFLIAQSVSYLSKLSRAVMYLAGADSLANEIRDYYLLGVINKNKAEVLAMAQEYSAAYKHALIAEKYIQKSNDTRSLWRIIYAQARFLSSVKGDSKDRIKSLISKAVKYCLETPPGNTEPFSFIPVRREQKNLFENAALLSAYYKDIKNSIGLFEAHHQNDVSQLVSLINPVFKKERHNIIWNNYHYIRRMLWNEKRLKKPGKKAAEKLNAIKKEYENYKQQIQEENNVLSYFAGAYEFSLNRFQNNLKYNQAAILFIPGNDSTLVVSILKDTVVTGVIYQKRENITSLIREWQSDTTGISTADRDISRILLDPVKAVLDTVSTLVFVKSEPVDKVPFEQLVFNGSYLGINKKIEYCPSLSFYLIASGQPKINRKELCFISDAEKFPDAKDIPGFRISTLTGREASFLSVRNKLTKCDITVLSLRMIFTPADPFGSIIFFSPDKDSGGLTGLRNLLSLNIKSSLAVILPKTEIPAVQQNIIAYTMLYSGVPTVLIAGKDPGQVVGNKFYTEFFPKLLSVSALESFHQCIRADSTILKSGISFMGFEGFSEKERAEFASSNINKKISKARHFYINKDYSAAKAYLEESLDMAVATGDTAKEGYVKKQLVGVCIKGGFWDSVVKYQKSIVEASSLKTLTKFNLEMSRLVSIFVKAKKFNEAASVQKEILNKTKNIKQREQSALYLAFLYSRARQFKKSAQWADSAAFMAQNRKDYIDMANALLFKGKFLVEGDSSVAAVLTLKSGIRELNSIRIQDNNILKKKASGYQLLGIAYEKLGRYNQALEAQQKALKICKKTKTENLEIQGWQYMANLLWKMGLYQDALGYQNKALKALEKTKNLNLLAAAYSTRGLIDMDTGNLNRAMSWLQKALLTAEKSKNSLNKSTVLKNMGLVSIQKNDFTKAAEFFNRALVQDSSAGYKRGLAYDKVDLGLLYMETMNLKKAVTLLKQGLDLSRRINDKRNQVKAMLSLGKIYRVQKKPMQSISILDSAAEEASLLGSSVFLWRIARQKGLALQDMGKKQDALEELKSAVRIVENLRNDLKTEELKQGFFGTKTDLYSDIVLLLLQMKKPGQAFSFAEQSQSRGFIDILAERSVSLSPEKKQVIDKIDNIGKAIETVRDSILIVKAGETQNSELLKKLTKELDSLQREYIVRVHKVKNIYPELASLITVDPVPLSKIQELLPDSVAIIKYFINQNNLIIWFVSNKKIKVKIKDISSEHLQKLVFKFRENMQSYLSVDNLARALYAILIRPVNAEISSVRHIIIAPHKVLHYLPFAALKSGPDMYLIDKHSISNIPSVSVLRFCLKPKSSITPSATVLAFGNPDAAGQKPLVFATKEIKAISRSFKKCKIITGKNATEKYIKDNSAGYDILHFACHAVYNDKAPLKSALFLAEDRENDGRLEASEIFGLQLHTNLVTLSGCQTGMNKISPGDEIIGFTRSFMFAGSESVLSSLWKVRDLETAVLIKRFYRSLKNRCSRAEALRKAQILVREMVNSHPAAWSGFTLTGNYQ